MYRNVYYSNGVKAVSMPEIEMHGNRSAMVEGCRGILEYAENVVRINANSMILCFNGRGLRIKYLGDSGIEIAGVISSLEFTV